MRNNEQLSSFLIQKVYTKDISFETINSPQCFKNNCSPNYDFNIDIGTRKIHENNFEINLTITIITKNNIVNAYIVEITKTGLFTINNIFKNQIESVLNIYCVSTLCPYAKRVIDSSIIIYYKKRFCL